MSIREALLVGKSLLRKANIEEADLAAEILLAYLLQQDRAFLFRESQHRLDEDTLRRYWALLEQRKQHWPVAYLTQKQEFFGLSFTVNSEVLIPRPETELLVEKTLERLQDTTGHPRVIDVGTGSGCIAIALAKHDPRITVVGIDCSFPALLMARQNAKQNTVNAQMSFVCADLLSAMPAQSADLIVTNPPYIDPADKGSLPNEVKNYEPHQALFTPTADATFFHRQIALQATRCLKPAGSLLLELGYGQADEVVTAIRSMGFATIRIWRDYQDIERVLQAQLI